MSLVFPKNPKNCQNQGFLYGAVMRICIITVRNLCSEKNYVFVICVLSAIKVFPKTTLKKIDCPTLVTPWSLLCTIFLPQDTLHVKKPKLSENQKIGLIIPGS